MCNYLAWNKTVQTLDRVLSVASRPGRCPNETCAGSRLRLLSAEAQSIALPHSTYGYDVLVRIGWWRYQHHATYREIHAELASHVRISVAHVSYRYQQMYLPLLACHERQHRDRLAQIAKAQGALIIALDGLAPEGGEPQLWCIRELTSGLTLRSGWLSQQDHTTFEGFLQPLTQLEWPILAVLSDKQTGLMPAVTKVLPESLSGLSGSLSAQPGRAPGRGRFGFQSGPSQSRAPAGGRLDPQGTPGHARPNRCVDGDGLVTESARPPASALGTRGPESAAERVARRDGARSR
jgi:hypothetical protein